MIKLEERKERFIKKSNGIWGNYFDYSKVNYINNRTNVVLIHDGIEYIQRPDHNLEHRLPLLLSDKHIYTTEEWKKIIYKKFPDFKYDLSKAVYTDSHTPNIILICHEKDENGVEHGEFKISSTAILDGKGCSKCKIKKLHNQFIGNKEYFLKRYFTKYDNDYDFTEFEYNGYNINGNIYCNKCNKWFKKSPSNLMKGEGCPICSLPKLEKDIYYKAKELNINIINQYSLINKNRKYDFYLPEYNTLIECQGEQHFFPVNFGGIIQEKADNNFIIQLNTDKEKYHNANDLGYNIIYYMNNKMAEYINKNNVNNGFYKDKIIYSSCEKLFNDIKKSKAN